MNSHATPEAPVFCLTPGDPDGIGPEVTAKALARLSEAPLPNTARVRVIGDVAAVQGWATRLGLTLPEARLDWQPVAGASSGEIAYRSLEAAVAAIHAREARALVTGPISKEALHAAGHPYGGHTEILQALARQVYGGDWQSDMLFVHEGFRLLLLTRHVPLALVGDALTVPGVVRSLDNLVRHLRDAEGIARPRLCLLGVNPHAGEIGGSEEREVLVPAIEAMNEKYGLDIGPPVAADAAFRGFVPASPAFDAYIAAYHDQGLIPMKLVAGFAAVNVTIGLPFLRTSVSHGTAPDIAGRGLADPASLLAALRLAGRA